MKILFLAPRLPLPADTGGKIRTLNILKQIIKWSDVHLVCFSFEAADQQHAETLKKMGVEVTLVVAHEPDLLAKIKGVVLDPLPFSIAKYYSKAMEETLRSLWTSGKFSAVHIDHLHMAHYRDLFKNAPCFLDEHNVEYRILERCVEVERSPLKRWLFFAQAAKMKTFEASRVRTFTRYFAVSEDDRKLLAQISSNEIDGEVIPNGVDTEYFDARPQPTNQNNLVFTGSMDWLPNEDAVLYFAAEILPLIWKKKPDVMLTVVGKAPTAAIKDLEKKDPRIVVTGRVDDVRPLMAQARVFIVPIRVGGGTRLKILEAMSMGKAIVSTTVGAEGINHTNGQDIHLADAPQDFANKVLFVLDHPQESEDLGRAARRFVCSQYDWKIIGARLQKIYQESIHGPQ